MQTFGKIAIRTLSSAIRTYLQRVPLAKGKSRVWDLAKYTYKRWPGLFEPCEARDVHGHRMRLRFTEYGERMVYFWGTMSPDTEWLLEQRLRPGDVFIDVGANIGYLTLLAAKLVGPSGKVFAFEPSPSTRAICERHLTINGYANVHVYPYAGSDRNGQVTFYQPAVGCDLASMRASTSMGRSEAVSYEVETRRLDEVLPPEAVSRIRLVKVDAEGADFLVLKGMEKILASETGPDVICEVNDKFLKEMGSSEDELLRYMRDLGYRAFLFSDRRVEELKTLPSEWYDVYFTRSSPSMGIR